MISAGRTRWRWLWVAHPAVTLLVVVLIAFTLAGPVDDAEDHLTSPRSCHSE